MRRLLPLLLALVIVAAIVPGSPGDRPAVAPAPGEASGASARESGTSGADALEPGTSSALARAPGAASADARAHGGASPEPGADRADDGHRRSTASIMPEQPDPHAGMPAGRGGFTVLPSPDGHSMLVTIDECLQCNKPSVAPTTTYVVRDGVWTELGVDVDASWIDGELHLTPRRPELGYSGYMWQVFQNRDAQGAAYAPSPFAFDLQVGGTDRAEWRVYDLGSERDDPPRLIMPAFNDQWLYSHWRLWWPDVPVEPVQLELWAEVRSGVPDDPAFIAADGTRWAVVWHDIVRRDPAATSDQTISLRSIAMVTTEVGWGVDIMGRIVRTADGGHTWRDVTPPGHARCDGRLWPRQTEHFTGDLAIVALTCDRTNGDGRWSDWTQQISVFTTADAGASWHEATIHTGYRFAVPASLHAVDGSVWLLAQPLWPEHNTDGTLWHSADGGRTWSRIANTDGTLPAARGFTFVSAQRGWALGPIGPGPADTGSALWRTDTSGALWHTDTSGALWRTDDGGRTWSEQRLPVAPDAYAYTPPQFLDEATGFFTVQVPDAHLPDAESPTALRQLLLATNDAGQTWSVQGERRGEESPHFLTPSVGYVRTSRGIAWASDGGRSWEAIPVPDGLAWPRLLQFVDAHNGFIVHGSLLQTRDGGQSWQPILPQLLR